MSEIKCIRVVRPQVAAALQQFVKEVVDAANDGWKVDPNDSITYHAVSMRPGDYMVTLVKGDASKVAKEVVVETKEKAVEKEKKVAVKEFEKPAKPPKVVQWLKDNPEGTKNFSTLGNKKLKDVLEEFEITKPKNVKSTSEVRMYLTKLFLRD